jgi:hypothetical protein
VKKLLLLCVLALASAHAEDIALPGGRILRHVRIAKFDGVEFNIEHETGIAHVAWEKMPVSYQARFPFDPERAETERKKKEEEIEQAKEVAEKETLELAEQRKAKRALLATYATPAPTPMELPHYNATTLADLKIGISADKVRRILGNPQRINNYGREEQWIYPTGIVYVENGVLTAMQNMNGGVFATAR